jgi:hypothetical protein
MNPVAWRNKIDVRFAPKATHAAQQRNAAMGQERPLNRCGARYDA